MIMGMFARGDESGCADYIILDTLTIGQSIPAWQPGTVSGIPAT